MSIGDWSYDKRPSDFRICAKYQGAKTTLWRTVGRVTHESDARMIAAAPDLLAAAQEALRDLTADGHSHYRVADQLRDAIALATGSAA
jgi:predicted phosphodiesterase